MSKREMTVINVTEVTIVKGKTKDIRINFDGSDVKIPVDESVYAYFQQQFFRENPTALQRKRFATVMNVLRAAYLKGREDERMAQ
ncbi:MAG TPA: hypothetical protein P5077_10530 [bacterium]|nr:hypothetical protein [bacterium]